MIRAYKILAACFLFVLATSGRSDAAVITSTLGNDSPGFNDGDTPDIFQLLAAQTGQPAPFDQGYGADPFDNFDQSWTHGYGAISDTILSASIQFGIVDHDSASFGDQLALFELEGFSLTASLNALFEGSGGSNGEYNVYSLTIPVTALALLADGNATFSLALMGPVETPELIGGGTLIEEFNGAHLIYSMLRITTEPSVTPTPEPGTLFLIGAGLAGLCGLRRRRRG